jgi:integrase
MQVIEPVQVFLAAMRYVKRQMPTMHEIQAMPPGRLYLGYGLVLKKTPTSTTWMYRYTSPIRHKPTETTIGPWPEYGYSSARQVATQLHVMVLTGKDPVQEARKLEANKTTFAEAAKGWIEKEKPSWRFGGLRDATLLLTKHGKPLADVPVVKITPDIVESALADLLKRHPLQARRALGMFARVFDYAKSKGFRTGDNPAAWRGMFKDRWPSRSKTRKNHYAALPYEDLPDFMRRLRLRQAKAISALALEFLILTASRTGEVLGMKWSEYNSDHKLWTIPADRMKSGREHRVPLSPRAVQILDILNEYRTGSDYVFTGYRRVALDDKALRVLLRSMDVPVTVHGFRSSFRDWAGNETHFARELIEQCLAHRVGNEVELAYRRSDALKKRREIMDAWTDHCCSLCG